MTACEAPSGSLSLSLRLSLSFSKMTKNKPRRIHSLTHLHTASAAARTPATASAAAPCPGSAPSAHPSGIRPSAARRSLCPPHRHCRTDGGEPPLSATEARFPGAPRQRPPHLAALRAVPAPRRAACSASKQRAHDAPESGLGRCQGAKVREGDLAAQTDPFLPRGSKLVPRLM